LQSVDHNEVTFDVTAAASVGSGLALSTFSTTSLEEVSRACRETGAARFFQLYVGRDHAAAARLVQRAERAGYAAVFITVDAPVFGKRRAQYYEPTTLGTHLQSVYTHAHTPRQSRI